MYTYPVKNDLDIVYYSHFQKRNNMAPYFHEIVYMLPSSLYEYRLRVQRLNFEVRKLLSKNTNQRRRCDTSGKSTVPVYVYLLVLYLERKWFRGNIYEIFSFNRDPAVHRYLLEKFVQQNERRFLFHKAHDNKKKSMKVYQGVICESFCEIDLRLEFFGNWRRDNFPFY
jgi:hypothetical protein